MVTGGADTTLIVAEPQLSRGGRTARPSLYHPQSSFPTSFGHSGSESPSPGKGSVPFVVSVYVPVVPISFPLKQAPELPRQESSPPLVLSGCDLSHC